MKQFLFAVVIVALATWANAGEPGNIDTMGATGDSSSEIFEPTEETVAPETATYVEPSSWVVDGNKCEISTAHGPFHLVTDGQLSNEMMYFKIWSEVPLDKAPAVSINTLPTYPSRLEGFGRFYSFEMPYTPGTVALLLSPDSFVNITWHPSGKDISLETSFATQTFPQAVAALAKECSAE